MMMEAKIRAMTQTTRANTTSSTRMTGIVNSPAVWRWRTSHGKTCKFIIQSRASDPKNPTPTYLFPFIVIVVSRRRRSKLIPYAVSTVLKSSSSHSARVHAGLVTR